MKTKLTCFIACAVVSTAFAPRALAAESEAKSPSQQGRFATCAHESKGLRGDDHQNFMSECLKGHDADAEALKKEATAVRASAEPSHQQGKMKTCNDEAGKKNLHGDERRAFMSTCLKG
jgi:psiF repeat